MGCRSRCGTVLQAQKGLGLYACSYLSGCVWRGETKHQEECEGGGRDLQCPEDLEMR